MPFYLFELKNGKVEWSLVADGERSNGTPQFSLLSIGGKVPKPLSCSESHKSMIATLRT